MTWNNVPGQMDIASIKNAATRHRRNDHATSVAGAIDVTVRAGTQTYRLLEAFYQYPDGLTDEGAAESAGLTRSCYWRRCTDLRQAGLIAETGQTRKGSAGVDRIVCAITPKGVEALEDASR